MLVPTELPHTDQPCANTTTTASRWEHPNGHEHQRIASRLRPRDCGGCFPPVHGEVVLVRSGGRAGT